VKSRNDRENGLAVVESLVALCLIGILIGVVIVMFQRVTRAAQETAVKAELVNIRTSVKLFQMLNGQKPASLKELMEKKVMLPGRVGNSKYSSSFYKENYLMKNALDAEGNKVDAFGNPFRYDSATGEVRSTTKGYEGW
jgi:competence protein ComGC